MNTKIIITGLIFSSIFIGMNTVAQNYQIGVTRRSNQYDVNVNQSSRRNIDFSGINMISGLPEYTGNSDLIKTIESVGNELTKRSDGNQDIYFNAYNDLLGLPINTECQKLLKDKLLNEFEINIKNRFEKVGWHYADVKKTIMDEILRINRELSENYDIPCKAPFVREQINNFIELGKYVEALSFYEKNRGDLTIYFGTSEKFSNYHNDVVIPLYLKVYNRNTAIRKYVKTCESDLVLAERTMSQNRKDTPPEYLTLVFNILHGYDTLKDWDKTIAISAKIVNFEYSYAGGNSRSYADALFICALRYYMKKDKENSLRYMEASKQIYKQIGMKKSIEWNDCEMMIKKIKKNDFSMELFSNDGI